MRKIIGGVLLALAAPCAAAEAPGGTQALHHQSRFLGEPVDIAVWSSNETGAAAAMEGADREIQRVALEVNLDDDQSPLAQINRSAGEAPVRVPAELYDIISAGLALAHASRGAFDPTTGCLLALWGFHAGQQRVPPADQIDARLPLVNYAAVALNPVGRTVFLKQPGMALDVNEIAEGYALERAAARLTDAGFGNVALRVNGDLVARGTNGGKPWTVDVDDPGSPSEPIGAVRLSSGAVATVGVDDAFVQDNVVYHGIIDPKTGYPARKCKSVVVVAEDELTAHALAMAAFVLGPVRALNLLRRHPGVEALIVDSDGRLHQTPGLTPQRFAAAPKNHVRPHP
jgi:thiamine biosynthesis lipoprotein